MGQSCCGEQLTPEDVAVLQPHLPDQMVSQMPEAVPSMQCDVGDALLLSPETCSRPEEVLEDSRRARDGPTLLADPRRPPTHARAVQDTKDAGQIAAEKTRLLQEAERLVDGGLDDWLRTWCNDEVLCAYLAASSKESAVTSLATALNWRRRHKEVLVGSRTPCWQGDMRVVARGALGHPVIFMSMQHQPSKSNSTNAAEHMAAVLEAACAAGRGAWGFDVVCDCRGFQLSKNLDPRPAVSAVEMLKHAYRGRMRRAFLVGAPVAFGGFWKLVKGLLPKPTQDKIQFISVQEAFGVLQGCCGSAASTIVVELLTSRKDEASWRFPSEVSD